MNSEYQTNLNPNLNLNLNLYLNLNLNTTSYEDEYRTGLNPNLNLNLNLKTTSDEDECYMVTAASAAAGVLNKKNKK